MGSNYLGSGFTENVRRWNKTTKEYVGFEIPEVVLEYNDKMGSVDKCYQLISYCTKECSLNNKNWTLRASFYKHGYT